MYPSGPSQWPQSRLLSIFKCLFLIKYATLLIKSVENEKNRRLTDKLLFLLILGIYRKLRNDDSLITEFYSVIIYREYNKSSLNAITSRLMGHLSILGNKNADGHLGGKGVKAHELHFRFDDFSLTHIDFHTTCVPLILKFLIILAIFLAYF